MRDFLPVNKEDMRKRGWEQCDFVYVLGDAYVDHPSFGPAIISRVLESRGYHVGIIAQPDWKEEASIRSLGEPRLGFLISGGNMDTMVNHYTVAKKRRQTDAYSPGGVLGKRPDRATIVYGNLIRKSYPKTPIIIGGIEASLRRMAHYDYWSDKVKRSILLDAQADILSYGMGETSIVEIAEALESGISVRDITFIRGTVYKTRDLNSVYHPVVLPSFDEIKNDKQVFAKSFYTQYCNTDPFSGKCLVEPYKETEYVVQNPPALPLTQSEMDAVYALPYMRTYHPMYEEAGGIPAIEELKFSLTSCRGCFGACNFCALTFHQGRIIQTRSHESILREAELLTWEPDFKGYINDVGGPTANFRQLACEKQLTKGACVGKQCLYPKPCENLKVDHSDYLSLLRKLRALPRVKKVFIRSGIRFDYLLADKDGSFFHELCEHHVSGQLKVAPEHISDTVLKRMGKPENAVYERFIKKYNEINEELQKEQYVVPYLMSSHPGSTLKEAVELALYLQKLGYMPEQVQDFYPTPSTISTCMYYTGLDPRTMEEVYVPRLPHEKALQRALIQYRNPKNHDLVVEALTKAGRTDLIGFGKDCLIRPRITRAEKDAISGGRSKGKNGNATVLKDGKKGTWKNGKEALVTGERGSIGKNGKATALKDRKKDTWKSGKEALVTGERGSIGKNSRATALKDRKKDTWKSGKEALVTGERGSIGKNGKATALKDGMKGTWKSGKEALVTGERGSIGTNGKATALKDEKRGTWKNRKEASATGERVRAGRSSKKTVVTSERFSTEKSEKSSKKAGGFARNEKSEKSSDRASSRKNSEKSKKSNEKANGLGQTGNEKNRTGRRTTR